MILDLQADSVPVCHLLFWNMVPLTVGWAQLFLSYCSGWIFFSGIVCKVLGHNSINPGEVLVSSHMLFCRSSDPGLSENDSRH